MPAVPFRRLEAEMLALYRPPHRRKSTWFKLRRVLSEFGSLSSVRKTSDITAVAITEWLDAHAGRAPMTNRSYLSSFRAAVNYAKKMAYIRVSPWDIRQDWITFQADDPDEDDPIPRHLSIDEIDRLLGQVDAEALSGGWSEGRLQALVYTYAHTGLRKMEALGLRTSDLQANGVLRVRGNRQRRLKTRTSARLVGVPDDLAVVLDRWIPRVGSEWVFPGTRKTKPWFYGSPGKKPLDQIKAVGKRAGIEHVTIQSFRHSLATHAKRLGLGQLELRDLLGHGSVRTQEWYLEEDADNVRDVARRIRFRSSAPPSFASPN